MQFNWRNQATISIACALALVLSSRCLGNQITLQTDQCAVLLDAASLELTMKATNRPPVLLSLAQTNLGPVAVLETNQSTTRISFPTQNVSLTFTLDGDRLSAHVLASEAGEFSFPVLSQTASTKGWILPYFEGVYTPAGDEKWAAFLLKYGPMNTTADLSLPFIGLDYGAFTLTCIFTNPFNNELTFSRGPENRLNARLTHQFTRNHPVKEYGVIFQLGTNSPVEPARIYRNWLIQRGEFVSFKEKISKTPAAEKLPGAAHIYLWGNELLTPSDVIDWKGFAKALELAGNSPPHTPGQHIWFLMNSEARQAVTTLIQSEYTDKYTESLVTSDLNRLLAQTNFYDEISWKNSTLDAQTLALLQTNRQQLNPAELCRLNSHLLAAAFTNFTASESWGNGVSPKMIKQLQAAGFDRLWLGSDGWSGFVDRPETVAAAKEAGFLIGPYDSFNSIHRPDEKETWETAQFGSELYQTGAIVKADGTKRRGFKKKGFVLSPDAARPYVEKRVAGLMDAFHANSWFIDCDGFGEYFDDYSDQHPATQQSDLQSRNSRMAWIRDTYGAVIGTEGCAAGVAATVHFAHGVMTPVIGWGDPDLTGKQSKYYLGSYYPPDEPHVFFTPVPVKEEYRYIYFDPRFRLPLFETVFHDSVIATHHWSWPSLKTTDQAKTIELLELLYQVPPLYHLNVAEFQKRKQQLKRHYDFFSPLHRETALLPMTSFEWLTPDGAVQCAIFGDSIEIVANFTTSRFKYGDTVLAERSVVVKRHDTGMVISYVP